jgi:hypothetical protein
MTGVMPCAIKHSIMADEHGAQQVWRSTLSAPPGTSSWNFFFFISLFCFDYKINEKIHYFCATFKQKMIQNDERYGY